MASSARIDEIKKKFDENPRRYFAPLANEFRKAGDLEQAILICEEFLPQQAGHMSGHIVYGQALFEAGRLPESRTVFETALGLDPENLIALRHLGDIASAQGEPVEARRWYDRVLEADPRNEEIQTLLATLDAGGVPSGGVPSGRASAGTSPSAGDITPIDLDVDESAFATPAPTAAASPFAAPDAPFEALSLEGFAPGAPQAEAHPGRAEGLEPAEFEVPTTPHARAEGLEPSEFEAPSGLSMRAEGLETTEFSVPAPQSTDRSLLELEGSFTVPGSTGSAAEVTPPSGLEESGAAHPPAADEPALPSLDLDQGLAVPAHGDALAGFATPPADVPLGQAAGHGAEDPRMEPPAAMEAMPALEMGEVIPEGAPEATGTPPLMELPPSVIAAESALMDAGDEYGEVSDAEESRAAAGGQAPFVTETMAELYLSQGFHAQALGVYRQLAAAAPGDARLRERVAMLERGEYDDAPAAAGPTVREFLFRMATRRPGEGAASALPPADADFASFDAVPEAPYEAPSPAPAAPSWERELDTRDEPEGTPESSAPLPFMDVGDEPAAEVQAPAPMPSPAERATTAQGGAGTGTIDALFGTRPTGTSEDSAASALAQAFGGSSEAPTITGRPARAASAELSLDSVFRDGPPRPPRVSQSFSFDQFFSESGGDAPPAGQPGAPEGDAGEPAERNADDVKQFNSWLQGLKPQ